MRTFILTTIIALLILASVQRAPAQDTPVPTPESPAQRDARLAWWRQARFGLFIHWGPVSITGKELSWSRANSSPYAPNNGPTPVAVYDNLYKQFNPTKFDANAWFDIARRAGMRYVVFTAKHCDGFINFDSKTIDYTITHTPFHRDVVAELTAASRKSNIPLGFYFSPEDWKDPDCRDPKNNPRFVQRMHAQLTELLTNYGKVPLIWFDYDGFPGPSVPAETATLTRRLQPGIVINNRLEPLHSDESHGRVGPWGDYATPEQFVGGYCDALPWETCMTLGTQWSFKPDDNIKSLDQCLRILVNTLGGDGNLLLDVGPMPTGEIEPRQALRLEEIGNWIHKNQEAIYDTRGGPYAPTRTYACTRTHDAIYLHLFSSKEDTIKLPPLPRTIRSATLLDGTPVTFTQDDHTVTLTPDPKTRDPHVTVIKLQVEGKPLDIPAIFPPSTTGSLAYRKPATVSSSVAPLFMHTAQAALDDNDSTFWTTGRDEPLAANIAGHVFKHFQTIPDAPFWQKSGQLEVDLGHPTHVSRALLKEMIRPSFYAPVAHWQLQAEQNGAWQTLASGTTIGKQLEVPFPTPVTAQRFRLTLNAPGRLALSEFQLFDNPSPPRPQSDRTLRRGAAPARG